MTDERLEYMQREQSDDKQYDPSPPRQDPQHQGLRDPGVVENGSGWPCGLPHDARYRALVLLATFASPRWGEVIALRRCDLDLEGRTVRVRAAYVERTTGNPAWPAEVQGRASCHRHSWCDCSRP